MASRRSVMLSESLQLMRNAPLRILVLKNCAFCEPKSRFLSSSAGFRTKLPSSPNSDSASVLYRDICLQRPGNVRIDAVRLLSNIARARNITQISGCLVRGNIQSTTNYFNVYNKHRNHLQHRANEHSIKAHSRRASSAFRRRPTDASNSSSSNASVSNSSLSSPNSSLSSPNSSSSSVIKADLGLIAQNEKSSRLDIVRSMMQYVWPKGDWRTKSRLVIALVLLVGGKLCNVQVPFLFKRIVDDLNIDPSLAGAVTTSVVAIVVGYGAARIGATLFSELRNAVFAQVAQRAIRAVSNRLFQHILSLDLAFHLSRQTGALTRALDRGTKGISFLLTSMVFHIVPITLEITMVCGILSYKFNWSYTAMTLGTMFLYSIFTITTTSWRTKYRRLANKADNKAAGIEIDTLLNYEAVKYFNNEKYEQKRYDNALSEYERASVNVAKSLAFLNSGQATIFSLALATMMMMGANGVMAGELTVGDLVMINQLVFQLSIPLNFLGTVYRELHQSMIDMEVMFALLKEPISIKSKPDALPLPMSGKGKIQFKNVSFQYVPKRPIIRNCSFTINPGTKVAFVGPSGCGKSTILKLLFRLYDINDGSIVIDGVNIADVDLTTLRQAIGVVPQDTPLFNDTIESNIRFGRVGCTKDEIIEVAKRARIDHVIRTFPEGYNTKVGERGLMISGGEKQRLAIARLLLKNPNIFIFDEATSALDTTTENSILANIRSILADRKCTSIFIAHRLRTIQDCDCIYVFDGGNIVEAGTHYELLALGGNYAQMWKAQADSGTKAIRQAEKQ